MYQIVLSGHTFSYTIIRKPIRSLRLQIKTSRSFVISSPRLVPILLINRFIHSNEDWIIKNAKKFKKTTSRKISSLKTFTILDTVYQLNITQSSRDSLVVFEDLHQIFINSVSLTNVHLKKLIDSKLRTHALKLINTHLSSFKNQYGFSYRNVSVRNQSSRFGSCSHVNNLNFNWQIIFFPLAQFQHILLHELTHTIVKDHSSRFWSQLAVYDPMWRSHRQWLKKEGSLQFLI